MQHLRNLIRDDAETELVFFVNGKKVVELKPDPEWTLLWYLRRKLNLTGTKYGCGEGGCGACTVMLSKYKRNEDRLKHIAVNACLTPVCAVHGMAVTTIEGIGSTADRLHPVQERIAKAHGSQCGFCTPGIVMSMYSLLRNNSKIHYSNIETALQGNLCRCTGYRPIIESFKTFMETWEKKYVRDTFKGPCMMGKDCCRNKDKMDLKNKSELFKASDFLPYDRTQEPIFPPELKLSDIFYSTSYLYFKAGNVAWIRPKNIQELLILKNEYPDSKIVVGNTEVAIEMKFKKKTYPLLLYPSLIDEMNCCTITETSVVVGAALSLTELSSILQAEIDKTSRKESIFETINNMLHWFAGSQIRNVASLVGNIMTASPISDLNPILMACSAILNIQSYKNGHKKVVIDENFFVGYRKTILGDDEVIVSVEIPFTLNNQYFKAYKQARRRDDDISIVTAAFNVKLENDGVITEAKFCFGGMGPTTICAINTSNILVGHYWNESMLNLTLQSLVAELVLDESAPGGMVKYRKSLCLSLFFKFYVFVCNQLNNKNGCLTSKEMISEDEIRCDIPSSSQYFDIKDNSTTVTDAVGKPILHASALKQATGEAIYCDDIPHIEGELYLSLVFSSKAHARIKSIDPSTALNIPGVVAFLSAKDLDEHGNKFGPIVKDEEIFSRELVTSRSCVIGAIVAENECVANSARDSVKVTYEPLEPVIITIEDAIKYRSFFPGSPNVLKKGNVREALLKSSHVLKGHFRSGAQEHFYLETLSAYAVRKEDELEIISTTQHPADIARFASDALNIPNHKIVSKVKRIGGGFGGKETRASLLAVPVAIAAYKLKKPVRAVLTREEDMQVTGYRHPFVTHYEVAFNDDGRIVGVVYEIFTNAGYSLDISGPMMDRAICHVDNSYYIPNIEVKGYICKTNMPSNTAFRGFGAPEMMLVTETMLRDVAASLKKSYEEIVDINMYREGQLTHFNQALTYCTLTRCWSECIESCDYWRRKKDVEEFNRSNRWKKKGIALVPTKYGISFQSDLLMQAGALVHIYNDGSVLLSIGGIEMGQGLYTKMLQVASRALEVDIDRIHISEMSTDKVPNSSPTAGSISSDLYGMAVLNACKTLKTRMEPFKTENPNGKWNDWVLAAYLDRVCLSATGFYAAPKIEYNPKTNSGNLYEYFTYGAACSEIVLDCLTGDHQVLKTDIVMDVGESLNPAIDIGQIEGAFMQGYGFCTLEELVFSPDGELLSRGPGAYKIPGFSDIPKVFNVSLLKGAPNPRAVYSSKAIGEPPLFLAASVFFAIKEAIKSARLDAGESPDFILDAPATCARIRMVCKDHITKQVEPTIKKGGRPWNVDL